MKSQPDERLVYLALKNIFRGADAQLRKPKKIRELILKQQGSIDVRDLIEAHNIDNVCNVARTMLEQQIFESTLKAKIRFPEVFEVSPAQSAERAVSEREAARTEADAIQGVAETSKRSAVDLDESVRGTGKTVTQPVSLDRSVVSTGKRRHHDASPGVTSLYPVYLPFQTQHRLLVTVQQILERACYDFATRSLPEVIEQEEWECAESVELNLWARALNSHQDMFSREDVDELGQPLRQLFDSIAQLRHTAVHRLRVSANRLELFLVDAESLAKLLRDTSCSLHIYRLRRETHTAVEDIKRHKDLLESQLATKMKRIAVRRAELDRLEQSYITDMIKEDQEYQQFAGIALDQAIDLPNTVLQSVAATEQDIESDGEILGCQPDTSNCTEGWE